MISPYLKQLVSNLKNKIQYGLTEQECIDGIHEICEFFGIPVPQLIQNVTNEPGGTTCVINRDTTSLEDDILCFNLNELRSMGVTDKISFMAVMTHECAHRVFQNHWFPGPDMGQWESEMVADYFMGVKIGLSGWNVDAVRDALAHERGSGTHPAGDIRSEYVRLGIFEARRRMIQRRVGTIQDYLTSFLEYREMHLDDLRKYELTIY